jgi:hypothetical protein
MNKATVGLALGLASRSIFALTAARAEPVGVVGIILFLSGLLQIEHRFRSSIATEYVLHKRLMS